MRSKKVIRYYCDHCNKGFWKKDACLDHEYVCYYKSSNRACGSCGNRLVDDGPWYCNKHDKDLTPRFDDVFTKENSVVMAKNNCEFWEKKDDHEN